MTEKSYLCSFISGPKGSETCYNVAELAAPKLGAFGCSAVVWQANRGCRRVFRPPLGFGHSPRTSRLSGAGFSRLQPAEGFSPTFFGFIYNHAAVLKPEKIRCVSNTAGYQPAT
jgi:hypothetical protein